MMDPVQMLIEPDPGSGPVRLRGEPAFHRRVAPRWFPGQHLRTVVAVDGRWPSGAGQAAHPECGMASAARPEPAIIAVQG